MAKNPIQVEIQSRQNEPVERMIRRFVKMVKKAGFLEALRERRYYEKPSTKRRKEKIRRKRVAQQAQEKKANK
jgi:small subunit ribosomal protein S21